MELAENKHLYDPYESAELNELHTALSKAQGEYKRIDYNRDNPFFKSHYADLDSIIQAIRPAFCKYGLSFTQEPRFSDDGATILHSKIRHSSGQWISSRVRFMPTKSDPQSWGKEMTYYQRYAAKALLGITVSHDPLDDDGEAARMEPQRYKAPVHQVEVVTAEQHDSLQHELKGYPGIAEKVLAGLNLHSLSEMPKAKYQSSIDRIREIKNTAPGVK